jgi:hypothetical protein
MAATYETFWKKIALMVKINIKKRDGGLFKIFDDSSDCLGVSYQTSWNWIRHSATPREGTLRRVVNALNQSFDINPPATLNLLEDGTSVEKFGAALGGEAQEIADAVVSAEFEADNRGPFRRFTFPDRRTAELVLSRISGEYLVDREIVSNRTALARAKLDLSIKNVLTVDRRYYIYTTLIVPSDQGTAYHYDGVICERSGLMYWIFSQSGVMLDDFIFMISDKLNTGHKSNAAARGKMITMSESAPGTIMSMVTIQRKTQSIRAK